MAFVEGIQAVFDSGLLKVAGSLATVVVLLAIAGGLKSVGAPLEEYLPDPLVEAGQAITMVVFLVLGFGVELAIWRGLDDVVDAVSTLDTQQSFIPPAVATIGLFSVAYVVTRFVKHWISKLARRRNAVSKHQSQVAHHVAQVFIYAMTTLVVLSLWKIDLSNVLLGAGFLGLVLGLAARQTLGAALAGFVVLFARPFSIGDWIEIEDHEGIVQDITIVNTQIKTFEDEYVMIPNDIITNSTLVNRSRKGRLRVDVDVGVDYRTDVETAIDVATEAMRGLDELRSSPGPLVVVKGFEDSAVVLGCRFWVANPSGPKVWQAKTEVTTAVKQAFDDDGIKIPFPQRELTGRAETSGLRVSGAVATREADDPGERLETEQTDDPTEDESSAQSEELQREHPSTQNGDSGESGSQTPRQPEWTSESEND